MFPLPALRRSVLFEIFVGPLRMNLRTNGSCHPSNIHRGGKTLSSAVAQEVDLFLRPEYVMNSSG